MVFLEVRVFYPKTAPKCFAL